MPIESHYDKPNKLIYHRIKAYTTLAEFTNSLSGEHDFFDQMTGKVGVVFDLSGLKKLPPSFPTIARGAYFVRYKPLIIGLIGTDSLIQAMSHVLNQITHASLYNFDSYEKQQPI